MPKHHFLCFGSKNQNQLALGLAYFSVEISPGLIGLSPLSAGHRRRFQPTCVRPSTGSYPRFSLPVDSSPGFASAARDCSPCSDSLSLRLASRLGLAARRNSLAHSTKGTPSQPRGLLRLLVGTRFQVLFHSPPGVLFTFPSRYWCAIGHRVVLRLGWWSTQIVWGRGKDE